MHAMSGQQPHPTRIVGYTTALGYLYCGDCNVDPEAEPTHIYQLAEPGDRCDGCRRRVVD